MFWQLRTLLNNIRHFTLRQPLLRVLQAKRAKKKKKIPVESITKQIKQVQCIRVSRSITQPKLLVRQRKLSAQELCTAANFKGEHSLFPASSWCCFLHSTKQKFE